MKVLIVDDEAHVIDAVRILVPWASMGIDEVLSANTVEQAMKIILEEHPEIAILDVMIGNETGIDLAHFINDQNCGTKIISISGYSDFDFVRGMFIYGCIDYLLKPIVEEQIIAALQKAVEAIHGEEKNKSIQQNNYQKIEKLSSLHFNMLLLELFHPGDFRLNYTELCRHNESIRSARQCMVLVCDTFFLPPKGSAASLPLRQALEDISHHLSEMNCGALLRRNHEAKELLILLYSGFDESLCVITHILNDLLYISGLRVHFGCSNLCAFPDSVNEAYEQGQITFMSAEGFCRQDAILRFDASLSEFKMETNIQMENQMLSALLIGDDAVIEKAVLTWMDFVLHEQPLTFGLLKGLWMYFCRLCQRWVGYFYNRYSQFQHTDNLSDALPFLQESSWSEIPKALCHFFCETLAHIHSEICAARESRSLMHEVADYLEMNYAQVFDQREYSDMFHINKDYLSRKFKETFHMGMVAYLTEIRIKRAKELLVGSDMKIQEISNAVGFQDEGYFTKLFKKTTSMSPGAFRALRLSESSERGSFPEAD